MRCFSCLLLLFGLLLVATGCSSLCTVKYYAPLSATGKTTFASGAELAVVVDRVSGPDNRITLTESGVTLQLGAISRDTQTMWLLGPLAGQTPIPFIPVFPLWWLFSWAGKDGLADFDLDIMFGVLESPVELTLDPEGWEIVTEKGEEFGPSSYSSWAGWEHGTGDATKPRLLTTGAHELLRYPTAGTSIKQFTLRPRFKVQGQPDIVFPSIILKRVKGTQLVSKD
jgi:hypothetical protein